MVKVENYIVKMVSIKEAYEKSFSVIITIVILTIEILSVFVLPLMHLNTERHTQ